MRGKEGVGQGPTCPRKGAFRARMIVKVRLSEETTACSIKLRQLFQGFEHASAPQFILHSPGAVIHVCALCPSDV